MVLNSFDRVELACVEACAALDAFGLIDHMSGSAFSGYAVGGAVAQTHSAADAAVGNLEVDQLGTCSCRTPALFNVS